MLPSVLTKPAGLAWHGAILVAATLAGASLYDGEPVHLSAARVAVFVAIEMGAGAVWLDAIRRRGEARLWIVLAVFALTRIVTLATPVFLSGDLARYVWDGRVQLAGISPYRYLPADPALAFLRDGAIYPFINRAATAPTIYPPAAQIVFALVAFVSPSLIGMRSAMLLAECLGVAALAMALRACGRPSSDLVIYAWLPLGAWEFAGNGHCDALVVMFVAIALLAVARPAIAAVALACATLVKFIPAVLLPALSRRGDRRFPAVFLLMVATLYALYASAGTRIFGFLAGYAGEESLAGGGLWPVAAARSLLPESWPILPAYALLATCILAAMAFSLWRPAPLTPTRAAGGAVRLGFASMLIVSPHYAWYFPWIAVPATLAPYRPALLLLALSPLIYLDPWHEPVMWRALIYVPPLALAAADAIRAALRSRVRIPEELT